MKNQTVKQTNVSANTQIKTGKIPDSVGFNGKGGGVLITKTAAEYAAQFKHMT